MFQIFLFLNYINTSFGSILKKSISEFQKYIFVDSAYYLKIISSDIVISLTVCYDTPFNSAGLVSFPFQSSLYILSCLFSLNSIAKPDTYHQAKPSLI